MTADIIDLLAGITPGSPLAETRALRPQARANAQRSFEALLEPAQPGDFPLAERYAIAAFTARIHRFDAATAFYDDLLREEDVALADAIADLASDAAQRGPVGAYRERFAELHPQRESKVAVGRIVVPLLDDHDRAVHQEFLTGYASGMDDEGRPLSGTPPFRFSKVVSGEPAAIVDALLADPAVTATDELVITLPANGDRAAHERILRIVAEEVDRKSVV